jgi:hypothetical protein
MMMIMNYDDDDDDDDDVDDDDGDDNNYVSQYQTNILHAHTGCLGTIRTDTYIYYMNNRWVGRVEVMCIVVVL